MLCSIAVSNCIQKSKKQGQKGQRDAEHIAHNNFRARIVFSRYSEAGFEIRTAKNPKKKFDRFQPPRRTTREKNSIFSPKSSAKSSAPSSAPSSATSSAPSSATFYAQDQNATDRTKTREARLKLPAGVLNSFQKTRGKFLERKMRTRTARWRSVDPFIEFCAKFCTGKSIQKFRSDVSFAF
jgi:hypothetical protein